MRQIDNDNKKPLQSTNDFVVLKAYANFSKPIFDNALSLVVDAFQKQNAIKNISIINAPNKSEKRIEEKVKEYDTGDYDKILDYVRGTIVFKKLEDLFDFINFSKSFDFSNLNLEKIKSKDLKIIKYGVNNFSLSKTSITDENIKKYPFLKDPTLLRKSEYMDYKLYMKIPMLSPEADKSPYMIAEILCILEDVYKFYELTHFLYEQIRIDIEVQRMTKNDLQNFQEFTKYMIYHIHRHNVIEEYNKKSENKIKLIEINPAKEQDKNNFFNSLQELSLREIIKILQDSAYNKTTNFSSDAKLQFQELLDNSFNRR